jgi:hypothetical protein
VIKTLYELQHVYPFKIQEKPLALKREHLALQNVTFSHTFLFKGSSLPTWLPIRIRNADPDPADRNQYRSGSTTMLKRYSGFQSLIFPKLQHL